MVVCSVGLCLHTLHVEVQVVVSNPQLHREICLPLLSPLSFRFFFIPEPCPPWMDGKVQSQFPIRNP